MTALLLLLHAGVMAGSAVLLALGRDQMRAWLHGRAGPPLLQSLHDLQRLRRKQPARVAGTWLPGTLPGLLLGSTVATALLLPSFALGTAAAPLSDLLVIAGLLTLGRCAAALLRWDGSPAEAAASAAGMTGAALAEPALLGAVLAVALLTGTSNLHAAASALREGGPRLPLLFAAPALALAALAGTGGLGENKAGAAGRDLAALRCAAALRRVAWVALVAAVALPFGLAPEGAGPGAWALGLLAWAAKLLLLGTALVLLEEAVAGLAPARVPALLGLAGLLAVVALLLFAGGTAA